MERNWQGKNVRNNGGITVAAKTKAHREKPVPVPICPSQITLT